MLRYRLRAAFLPLIFLVLCPVGAQAQPQPAPRDGVAALLRSVEQAAAAANGRAILALGDPSISRPSFEDFAYTLTNPAPTRLVLNERDRAPLPGRAQRLIVEIFSESGIEGRLGTWRVDVQPGAAPSDPWRIAAVGRLSIITGLYRLSLNASKQYDIHNLTVHAPDLTIEMTSGRAFVAESPDGPTALVLLGRGRMRFTPPDAAERIQVKVFGGAESLVADIDMAFLRLSPAEFASHVTGGALRLQPVVPGDLRDATTVFNDHIGRTLQVDLSDISRDRWSLLPSPGDFIGELHTRKFGTLTYTRSASEAEDITLFDRKERHNISVYASAEKLAERGRFYSEDDQLDYDILSYEVDAEFTPDRGTMDGNTRIRLKMLTESSSLTFRLADSLVVRGVYSPAFGRLLHLRVLGQNSVIVNLPAVMRPGAEVQLNVLYGGRIAPQVFDREAIQVAQELREPTFVPIEQRWLYSNRSYWYPQATVTDYATAKVRITVPADFDAVATGDPAGPPTILTDGNRRRKVFTFDAAQPSRYLAAVVTRMDRVSTLRITAGGRDVSLYILTSPRQAGRIRDMGEKAAAVLKFYASLVGDAPYPSFTLAVVESDRPGGHSPPYFALLNQVVAGAAFVWRNDPVSFDNYPTFFLAHEVAHQWWGHAVGWKNYHEQWISEGFAQYFAALYAEKDLESNVLPNLLRQMRHTAIAASGQGPVYLGYRLGHIRADERVFRSVIYNKAAMVLHMLRRLVGDEAFFSGVRSFYEQWKFKKAGTDDFRQVMERASGRDLSRFFETWIYGSSIPRIKFGTHLSADSAHVRFEQRGDPDVGRVAALLES
ncbi:MAG TPA: M1 family aminopeptidase, partial [Vicinamibacterales bacterium]|nr:M1 family aminopeptidase [Vicinamibacterales bacterium]